MKRSAQFSLVKWLTRTIVPPGMQTRRISAAKRAGFGTTEATYSASTESNELSSNSRFSASITCSASTLRSCLRSTRRRAFSSISAEMSMPVTRESGRK